MNALFFFDAGVPVFPIKDRSKEPACFWTTHRASRPEVARFINYGVPLGTLAVLDPDSADLVGRVREGAIQVPDTPLVVHTARGLHLYYRLPPGLERVPKFVRRAGISIEFRNKGQYVVGPGSIHPSGHHYYAQDWSWRWDDIPFFPVDTFCFDDGSMQGSIAGTGASFDLPDAVFEPERHETLNSWIASLVCSENALQFGDDIQALRDYVRWAAEQFCASVCHPPLPWDDGFFQRSFQGALRLRDRRPTVATPMGVDPWT